MANVSVYNIEGKEVGTIELNDAVFGVEALSDGCGADAPGSYAAWLSRKTPMHAYVMPGKRYDIGDVESYERVRRVFEK